MCTTVFPGLDKEWREVLHKLGTTIVEKGEASSIKLLCKKDATLPNWIRLLKLQGDTFQKI